MKWGEPVFGAEATVTYGLVNSRHDFADARNCTAIGPVQPILFANEIDAASFERELTHAFRAWENVSGIRFRPAASSETADILIGADLAERGWAHADVKYTSTADGIHAIERGIVCLSPAKSWKIGFGENPEAQDMKYTLTHEIGHAIGLNHASPRGQLMSFTYGENISELQSGDVEGARILYGAPREGMMAATLPEQADR